MKMQRAGLLKLERINLHPHSVFVSHGYIQLAGAKYLAYRTMRQFLYLMPSELPVDAFCYTYGSNMKIGSSVQRPLECENDDDEIHIGEAKIE